MGGIWQTEVIGHLPRQSVAEYASCGAFPSSDVGGCLRMV